MSAVLSDCGRYRYTLEREWMTGSGTCLFIMLNPSIADAEQDDPTIRRCVGFAQSWGCQRLTVANLFAFRSPKPSKLLNVADPVGPENDDYLGRLICDSRVRIAAWGSSVRHIAHRREARVVSFCRAGDISLHCLGVTRDGFPRHPLYIKADTQPIPFALAPEAA